MTVSILNSSIEYVGNGITTAFDFPFLILEDDDIQLYNILGGVKYPISASLYSVSGIGNPSGGTVTFVTAPVALYRLRIERMTPYTQPATFSPGGGISPKTVENALDRSTLQIQQLANLVSAYTDTTDSIVGDIAGLLAGRIDVPSVASVAALRAGTYTGITLVNLLSWVGGTFVGGGLLRYDPTDIATADNSTTTFVSADGKRWKRLNASPVDVTYAGALADNATDASAAFALADAAATALGTKVEVSAGTFYLASNVTMVNEVLHFGRIRCASVNVRYRDANPLRFSDYKRRYSTDQLAFEGMLRDQYFGTASFRMIDMEGMQCVYTTPIDWAAASNKSTYNTSHRIKNGVFIADATFPATVLTTKTGGGTAGAFVLTLSDTTGLTPGQFVSAPSARAVTITIASPGVFSATAHGLVAGQRVVFATTGSLPTGVTAGVGYFVIAAGLTANAFEISATSGGAAVNTSGSQSGTHTVAAPGVAIESYIVSVNAGANQVTLNTQLFATFANQSIVFKEFKYLWDCANMANLGRIRIEDCNFDGLSLGSCIRMSQAGIRWSISRTNFVNFLDRAVTDWNLAASGMRIADECLFAPALTAVGSVGITFSDNDAKVLNNHFLPGGTNPTPIVGHGSGYQITSGNHIVGDDNNGVVLTGSTFKTEITCNYIDNCYVVFGDEASNTSTDPIQGLTCIGNTLTAGAGRAASFVWFICKPTNVNKKLAGIIIKDNVVRKIGGAPQLNRMEKVDTTYGSLDPATFERVYVDDNEYENIVYHTKSRPRKQITVAPGAESATWNVGVALDLPFGANAMRVLSAVLDSPPKNAGATIVYPGFYTSDGRTLGTPTQVQLNFTAAYSGTALITADCNVAD